MTTSRCGTVAQLVYAQKQQIDFAGIVGDLHALLVRFAGTDLIFEWDCDEIALFDLPKTRIALGWDVLPGKGYAACLTVSASSVTELTLSQFGAGHHELCSRLVERLHRQFPASAIIWHQINECLTADLIDRLVEGLTPAMQMFPFEEPKWMADALEQQLPHRSVAKQSYEPGSELATRAINSIGQWANKLGVVRRGYSAKWLPSSTPAPGRSWLSYVTPRENKSGEQLTLHRTHQSPPRFEKI